MLELFETGGIMMYPLVLCSFLTLTVFFERLWSMRRAKIMIPEVITVVEQLNKKEDLNLAKSVCEKFDGPFPNIIVSTINNFNLAPEDLRVTVEDEGRQQVRTLSRGLSILETVAGIAPLLGLLGTVLGMIEVFNVIEELGVGQAKALSGGIAEALVTTATGLFIGIPALIAFNYFNTRSEGLILDIENYVLILVNKIIHLKNEEAEPVEVRLRSE
ncbi:MAG: MotA/TolQ/ExbB proton channel family protein [Calditrichia bacterium]